MKKFLLLVLLGCAAHSINAQEIYFYSGKNLTNYRFKNNSSASHTVLQSGSGDFYEIGYSMPLDFDNFNYSIGLSLNEYNAVGNSAINTYTWNTDYLGVVNAVNYTFFNKYDFDVSVKGGIGLSTIIYGKQNTNGAYFDLLSQKEFSGIFIQPVFGFQTKYNISSNSYLSFGYNFSKSINLFNSSNEHLSFNNNQFQFGVHFVTN